MSKASGNPLLDAMDISKFMGEMKMPALDFEQGILTLRRNMEAMTAANQLALEGCQAVLRRQMDMLKTSMQEASTMVNELSAAGTPEDKVARQLELVKQAYERSLSNIKDVQEMITKSNDEAIELISDRVSCSLDEIKSVAKKAAKKAA